MTSRTLIFRSLRFHARAHLGVLLGAAVGSAALIGALVVGDSVRGSLRDLALARLGRIGWALPAGDRFFKADLEGRFGQDSISILQLPGTATAQIQNWTQPTRPRSLSDRFQTAQTTGATNTEVTFSRANHVQVLGVTPQFFELADQPPDRDMVPHDSVVLNEVLAAQLKVKRGDTIVLRIQKPSLLSRDAPLTPQEDYSVAMRLPVFRVISDAQLGRFSLQANQVAPFNAFVNLQALQEKIGQTNRANLLLAPVPRSDATYDFNKSLGHAWQLTDAGLELRKVPGQNLLELHSDRVFLDPPVVEAAQKIATNVQPVLTYFVNELRVGDRATPYSMVAAIGVGKADARPHPSPLLRGEGEGAPIVPADMHDDEIIINQWLADDLQAKAGDTLRLTYYVIGTGRALEERQNSFRVRRIVPLEGAAADRSLMPEFPGLAKAESSRDWDAGFPIQLNRIRDQDEKYWHNHRGTPKAFVTLAAGQRMWANRFGDVTSLRFPGSEHTLYSLQTQLLNNLDPASVGLSFQPVRQQALAASSPATDFGGLFLGFSFFLIVAALLLMALLFQFGLEQRATEIGTLLALGFRPKQVRSLLLREGEILALVGGVLGAVGGIIYALLMVRGLTTVWRSAVGTSSLHFHVSPLTLLVGVGASTVVGTGTIWLALRKQARRPARELLAQGADLEFQMSAFKTPGRSLGKWIGVGSGLAAIATVGWALWQKEAASADTFFSAGALLLIAGLGFAAAWLARLGRSHAHTDPTLGTLGLRSSTRRRKRSLATIGLLACGVFLIASIGAFHLDANSDATKRSSGTGGFALIGESALPVTYDLNNQAGRDFYSLNPAELKDVSVVSFRVRDGDDASCLNLNQAQKPRLLGVNPEALQLRHAFTFAGVAKGLTPELGWHLLKPDQGWHLVTPGGTSANSVESGTRPTGDEIPAIGDANSIQWALHKSVGDTIDYTDERGRTFKLRLVGAVANSILQGSLVIDEAEFVKRFPSESGYRMFLIDAPSNSVASVSSTLSRALQDAGLELTPAAERLNAFNAVQNTYLSTFQVLGGLGLLLGSAGLGIVVLRNVQERRGELGLLTAVGFRRRALHWLVLSEHGALLGAGLAVGLIAAAVAVMPSLLSPGAQIPYASLALTLAGILANGLLWTWLATRFALRGKLLDALRNN